MTEQHLCFVCKRKTVKLTEHKGKSYIFKCYFCSRIYLCNKSPKKLVDKKEFMKSQQTLEES